MNGALEIQMPPTGNHRNRYTVGPLVVIPKGQKAHKWCPNCGSGIAARVMVNSDAEYVNWKTATAWQLVARYGKGKLPPGPVVVSYWIYGGSGFPESRDHDNAQKCLGDAIVASGVLPGDDVRYIKGWRPWYYDREEHLALLGGRGARRVEDLKARCFVHIEPAKRVA